jgi:hypothetical protein
MPLFKRHVYPEIEALDDSIMATVVYQDNKWYLVNNAIPDMFSPRGNRVHHSGGILLEDNTSFMLSQLGFLAESKVINNV